MTISSYEFQQLILNWFDQHGRKHLPWQHNKTAYRVWVSEIMLQQTQVNTVIPYFERFMQQFPQLNALADAPLDEVLHLWTGLGYYSRARNLHKTAKMIMTEFNGKFPSHMEDLQKLPGVGRSTAAAISSIAFNQNNAILDGNVKRVLIRFQAIDQIVTDKKTENKLWELADYFMPEKRCADYTQAVMDLGAAICIRSKPLCPICPLTKHCKAFKENMTDSLPKKKTSKSLPVQAATFIILQKGKHILLRKRPPMGIWGGLWSFPEIKHAAEEEAIRLFCQQQFKMVPEKYRWLKSFRHTFSHYHLDIFPVIIEVKRLPAKIMEAEQQIWYNLEGPVSIGLPRPVQLIMRALS